MNTLYTMIDTSNISFESFLRSIDSQKIEKDKGVHPNKLQRISTMRPDTLKKIRSERDRYEIIKLSVPDNPDLPIMLCDIKKAERVDIVQL
jgi:hypothetical protein